MTPLHTLGAVLSLLSATPTAPHTARWGLQWASAPGCIQAEPLALAVEKRLGRSVFGLMPDVLVHGALARNPTSGWTARLTLVDAQGTVLGGREVSTSEPSCAALEPRLALVIALMIDPDALRPGAPRESMPVEEARAPEPEPAPVTQPEPSEGALLEDTVQTSPSEDVEAPRRSPWPERSTVSVAATASTGLGSRFSPGGSIAWRGAGAWTWLVRLAVYPHTSSETSSGPLELFVVAPEAGTCPLAVGGSGWELSGCATVALSFVSVDLRGAEERTLDLFLRGDAGPRLHLERRLGLTTALHLGLGATLGWLRPTLPSGTTTGASEGPRLGAAFRATLDVGMSFRGP